MKNILIIIFIGLFFSSCGYGTIRHLNDGTCVVDNKPENDVEWCRGELEDARRYEKYQREQAAEKIKRREKEIATFDVYNISELCKIWDQRASFHEAHIWTRNTITENLKKRGQDPLYCKKREINTFDAYPTYELCVFWDHAYSLDREHVWNRKVIAESLEKRGEDPLLCRKTSSSRPPIIVEEKYKFGDKYLKPFFKDRQEKREREREHNEYDH